MNDTATETYVDKVIENLHVLYKNKTTRREVESHLSENHGISKGDLQLYLNNKDELFSADLREVALIGEQIYLKGGDESLSLDNNFKSKEVEEIRQYYKMSEIEDEISLPLVIHDVNMIANGTYSFPLNAKLIAQLFNSKLLNYNFDIQRQAKYVKRQNRIVKTPTINESSVDEITKHLINGTLIPTNVVYNAALGTSDSDEELIYDSKERTITITEGTRLDILDGMHRTLACVRAHEENKEINFNFIGLIFNFNTRLAQAYQAQLAKANPIPKSRIQELEKTRQADLVVQQLRLDSELKNRITSRDKFSPNEKELVSYGVLTNAIDTEFKIKNKLEAMDVADYLSGYFMYLFGYFQHNLEKVSEDNLMFYNKMFIGHIRLARRMRDKNIPVKQLKTILDLDFSRGSELLANYKIIDQDLKFTLKNEKRIIQLFNDIELKQ